MVPATIYKGLSVDPVTGNITGSEPAPIRISNALVPAQATTQIAYTANLPRYPLTTQADTGVANSELLDPTDYTNDPTVNPPDATDGFIRGDNASTFLQQSLSGGAITIFDSTGAPLNVQMRWAKVDSVQNGGADTWQAFYQSSSTATGATPAWTKIGGNFTFAANGQLSPAIPTVTQTVTVDGISVANLVFQFGSGGLTQFADADGTVQITSLDQDGFAAGEVSDITISEGGRVTLTYTNGQLREVAEITLADFNADNKLRKLDGGLFFCND
jgi:flagellar hook protein FlgE